MKQKMILTLIVTFSLSIFSQNFDKNKMDEFLKVIEDNDKGMGTLSIFKQDKEIYSKSYGYRNIKEKINNNSLTKYRIGSISKTFTAALIFQLIDEGKIDLNTKLSKYFPQIPNSNVITIAHLLQHKSGLFNFTRIKGFNDWRGKKISRKKIISKIASQKLDFTPGEKTEYSNTNYILLSIILEKVEKDRFKNILRKRITSKNNLKNTFYGKVLNKKNNEAISYNYKDTIWKEDKETHFSIPIGAGGIASTPKDLNTFFYNLFKKNIVSEKSLEEMKKINNGMGMGLFYFPFYEHQAFGHEGSIDAFQSVAAHFPKENVTIAICSNGVVYPINSIMANTLGLYFNKDFKIPVFKKSVKQSSLDLDKYLGKYSGPEFPLKVSVTKKANVLVIQAEGQPEFSLKALGNHEFEFEEAQIKFTFQPKAEKLIVVQGGKNYVLNRLN